MNDVVNLTNIISLFFTIIISTINILISILTIAISITGGIFALLQWKKSNDYKRAELVKELITKIRDDEDIAFIMDCLDWQKDLSYDGIFHYNSQSNDNKKEILDDVQVFIKVDKTLSHFSYICYLYERKIIKNKDILQFNYNLRRIMDNTQIANYLYSLYHWSNSLGVDCSFVYLIKYGCKMNYLNKKEFYYFNEGEGKYKSFLGRVD